MARRLRSGAILVIALGMVACGSETAPPDGGADASSGMDGGPQVDAGVDAGPRVDSSVDGGTDAAFADAGTDGGELTPDGGAGCDTNADCGADEYCQRPLGVCSGRGVCAPKDTVCLPIVMEVCGCDGETYGNECAARSMGMNVAADGPCGCERPSEGCCFVTSDCERDQRCVGAVCAEGGEGTCVAEVTGDQCWEDADCPSAACVGARRCPCGALCILPDAPGTCAVTE